MASIILKNSRIWTNSRLLLTSRLCSSDANLGKCSKEHDETIYKGILSTQVKLVKGFSLATSGIGLACQPILFHHLQNGANVALVVGTGAFLSFFTFATPLILHHFCKKYVTELNYNRLEDTYTAITYSFFLRKKETKFKTTDVKIPEITSPFYSFRAHNVPLLVDEEQFIEDPYKKQHYIKIMGFDKPIDFRWKKEDK